MIFLTYWFVIFAAAFFALYWVARPQILRQIVLLAGCVIFHAHFAGPAGVIPIIVLGLVTYLAGLSRNRYACRFAMTLCVLALVFYKYSLFLVHHVLANLSAEVARWAQQSGHGLLSAAPPLAISFFAFEFVHYLYDVSHG